MYLKYNYKYCLCSKIIINNLCPIKIKIAIINYVILFINVTVDLNFNWTFVSFCPFNNFCNRH